MNLALAKIAPVTNVTNFPLTENIFSGIILAPQMWQKYNKKMLDSTALPCYNFGARGVVKTQHPGAKKYFSALATRPPKKYFSALATRPTKKFFFLWAK